MSNILTDCKLGKIKEHGHGWRSYTITMPGGKVMKCRTKECVGKIEKKFEKMVERIEGKTCLEREALRTGFTEKGRQKAMKQNKG